ncbi:hypothetical protein CFter6_4499 [Collimonas fungivorans]|uniref:Uncharacterized protein n=1 Tax=Collimonas fungivorans TaxID=158899 RepID=A0A127PH01_9BURK|nr:hypothetical protein CFter6_4499 [Collimonas fungivorans]
MVSPEFAQKAVLRRYSFGEKIDKAEEILYVRTLLAFYRGTGVLFSALAGRLDTEVLRSSDMHPFKYLSRIWHDMFYAIGNSGVGEKNRIKTNLSSQGSDFV